MSSKNEQLDKYYEVVLKLVQEAGKEIKNKTFLKDKRIETKSTAIDFVTETDQEIEQFLISNLSKHFPNHKFIGEESVSGQCLLTDAPTWIIDPIDGTMNFVHSFPFSCISVALYVEKKPEIGIIYNPNLDQCYTARKGKGAFLNDKPIRVANTKSLSEALLMMEFGSNRDPEKMAILLENQNKLIPKIHGLRILGACAMHTVMVASGAADAFYEFGHHVWDIAAGQLIVTEAGGVIIDPAGGEFDLFSRRLLVASSKELAESLAKELVQYYPMPRD